MIAELTEVFTTLGQDPAVRVIVLAGQGKAFRPAPTCSG